MIDIQLLHTPLQSETCIAHVESVDAGGLAVFIGTVRRKTQQKTVIRLEFEGYEPMAIAEMRKIAETTVQKFGTIHFSMHHRIGVLYPGEIAVVIAVSTAHRAAAFDACRYAIDTLKETVPIWKKEVFEDGSVWVAAHP
jgi:molybdopterin synthase catalytic subunit